MSSNVLQIVRGSEYSSIFTVNDDAGAVVDLTGATVSVAFRHPLTRAASAVSSIVAISDALNGQCSISIDETETLNLELGCLQEMVITVISAGGVTDKYIGANVEGL